MRTANGKRRTAGGDSDRGAETHNETRPSEARVTAMRDIKETHLSDPCYGILLSIFGTTGVYMCPYATWDHIFGKARNLIVPLVDFDNGGDGAFAV